MVRDIKNEISKPSNFFTRTLFKHHNFDVMLENMQKRQNNIFKKNAKKHKKMQKKRMQKGCKIIFCSK